MLMATLGLDKQAFKRVVPALFAYLFDRINLEGFIKYVNPESRREGTRIKDIARTNGYILKNCKLYAYACHVARLAGDKFPKPTAYKIDRDDAHILQTLNLYHLKAYPAFTLKAFDAMIAELIQCKDLRNYIGKFVTKKMSFLINSYGESRHDIEAMLSEKAILAVYKKYPQFESSLHVINIAKAQIHNQGQSFITHMTSARKQKLQVIDGMHQSVIVSTEVLADLTAAPEYGADLKEGFQALHAIEHKIGAKAKEFLLCAAGQPHMGLSEYLRCDNTTLAEKNYGRYMEQLHQYFGVTPERTARLYDNLRREIHRCQL